jgi:hypothetical protein
MNTPIDSTRKPIDMPVMGSWAARLHSPPAAHYFTAMCRDRVAILKTKDRPFRPRPGKRKGLPPFAIPSLAVWRTLAKR